MRGAKLHAIVAAVFLAGAGMTEASAAEAGRVLWVIDGDTYQIAHAGAPKGESVRARHFDTPERLERAGCDFERALAERATAAAMTRLLSPCRPNHHHQPQSGASGIAPLLQPRSGPVSYRRILPRPRPKAATPQPAKPVSTREARGPSDFRLLRPPWAGDVMRIETRTPT